MKLILVLFTMLIFGCTQKSSKPTLWIYTSAYNHVVQDIKIKLEKKFPEAEFQFYQSGSENVAAKVNSELLSGKTQADLILTSNPFWYEELKEKKQLLPYDSSSIKSIPDDLKDPDHFYTTVRVPVMVIAYHQDVYTEKTAPKKFADLALPEFKNKTVMGNPLESGTSFTLITMLSRKLGWDYIQKLRENGMIATGGNSSVLSRIETKERPVGIVLLENVLTVQKKNPKIKFVYPEEGPVVVPSPIAITAQTQHPDLAKKVYDYFFSSEIQSSFIMGDMYSVLNDMPAPEGAQPWKKTYQASIVLNHTIMTEVYPAQAEIKKKFSKVMLE